MSKYIIGYIRGDRLLKMPAAFISACLCMAVLCMVMATAAAIAAEPAPGTMKVEKVRLSPAELTLWNDPAFQKRFIESYIAETEIEPRVTADERREMQKILALISADQLDLAAGKLIKSRGEASSAVFDFTLANIYFRQDKLTQAADAYVEAVVKFPKFRRAWNNLGLIYIRQGNFPKALPALTRVIELGGNSSLTYGLLGYAYSSVGNSLSAESAYRMAILLDPATMDWQMGLVRSLFKQQRYPDAAAMCGILISKNPDRADLWMLQANAYIGLGQAMKAAENYELIDRLGESTVDSLNMLGDIYVNEELFEMAVNSYIRAMEKDPGAPADRSVRAAKVLVSRGALGETVRLLERIDRIHSNDLTDNQRKDILKLKARIAVAHGSGDEEARVLEKIIEIDPLDGEALILLGQHSSRAGDMEKAVFYYERASGIEKFEADAKVRHAQLLVGQAKYNKALSLLNSAQKIKPRDNIQKYIEQVERVARKR